MLDEAIVELKEAIRLKVDNPEIHNDLGGVYMKKGMYEEAIAEFEKAIEINPDYTQAQNNLRMAQLRLARMKEK